MVACIGVVDGLGGTVKRSVWRFIRCGKGQATTPLEFHHLAKNRNPNINIDFIPASTISEKKEELEARWDDTVPVTNTQKIHFVMPVGSSHLLVADTSDSPQKRRVTISVDNGDSDSDEDQGGVSQGSDSQMGMSDSEMGMSDSEMGMPDSEMGRPDSEMGSPNSEIGSPNSEMGSSNPERNQFEKGDWVIVQYMDSEYPGEIIKQIQKEPRNKVNVMHKSGPSEWKWPKTEDKIYYFTHSIKRKIDPPLPSGYRGRFAFDPAIGI